MRHMEKVQVSVDPAKFRGFKEVTPERLGNILADFSVYDEYAVRVETLKGDEVAKNFKAIYNASKGYTEAVLTKEYHLVQHYDAFAPVAQVMADLGYEKAMASSKEWNGRAVLTLVFPELKAVDNGNYLYFGMQLKNNVKGTGAIMMQPYGLRGACSNGMLFGEKLGGKLRKVHSGKDLHLRMAEYMAEFKEKIPLIQEAIEYAKLSPLAEGSEKEALKLIGFGKGQIEEIVKQYAVETTTLGQTRWSLYNAITNLGTHAKQKGTQEAYLQRAAVLLTTPQ